MYAMVPKQIVILIRNTTVITLAIQLVTILAKVTVVKPLMLEDAADIEDNIINTQKPIVQKCTIGFCRMLQEYYLIHQNTVSFNVSPHFNQEFILLKYSMAFGVKPI